MNGKKLCAALLAAAALLTAAAGCAKDETGTVAQYDYDLSEYVRLGKYIGVEIEDADLPDITNDIDSQIMLARSNYATVVEKKGEAALQDQLNISYVGTMDGVAFAGGTDDDCDLTLGSGLFIDGFEEGLLGAKAGDTVTLNLHFPNPYPNMPEYAGQAVTFTVKVNHVYEQILPPYTDEFVKNYYGYDTVEAFEEALSASLAEEQANTEKYYRVQTAWMKVLEEAEVLAYPDAEYNAMFADQNAYYSAQAKEKGISLNEYVSVELGMTVKEFNEWLESETHDMMKEEMVLRSIARQENITVSDKEYKEGALEYATYYGLKTVEELEAYFEPAQIRQNILFDKVLEFIGDAAVVKG